MPLDLPTVGSCKVVPCEVAHMNIGEAAKVSGVNAKLIRHYESIGIIPKASRSDSGYRVYSDAEVNVLLCVARAGLDFP